MHPTWVPGVYSRFVPRKAWVRRLDKFLGVFHFLWSMRVRQHADGLRDVHVLPDADEPRRGLPHAQVGGRVGNTSTGDATARWLPAAWET